MTAMKLVWAAIAASGLMAGTARAETWHVTGTVSGRAFAVDCRLVPQGGTCVDMSTGESSVKAGKVHKLTQFSVNGRQVQWAYQSSVMLMPITISYSGDSDGARMTGTMTAAGRNGTFTATRIQP
jgi:hypothetical protein